MMDRKALSFNLFLWLLLTACQGSRAATATPTAAPSESEPAMLATISGRPGSDSAGPATFTPKAIEVTATETSMSVKLATLPPATIEAATVPPLPTLPLPANTSTQVMGVPALAIQLQAIVTAGLTRPVFLGHASDERLLVVEQAGAIRIIRQGQLLNKPFLDIRDRVNSSANEQGLLSVAFHPHYATDGHAAEGYFFVNYTNRSGDTVIARYQVSSSEPNRADPDSEVVLLTINQPFRNHNGGQLQFGPDGYLYVGMGDGGSGGDPQGNGQNAGTLLGAMLRLEVDNSTLETPYRIPDSNPFAGQASRRAEIWATGLRNPWRFSFDRLTGDLYLADVGQNSWEEVDYQPAGSGGGENYGWNLMEGRHCFASADCDPAGLELPIFEYDHGQGCSVTGGYVYRGRTYPQLSGNYFVADYCTGAIWSLFPQGAGSWIANQALESTLAISSFGQDAAGELYVLDHGGGVYQIQP